MTNEHATLLITAYKYNLVKSCSNQLDGDIEAFNMALEALDHYRKGKWQVAGDSVTHYYACSVCGGPGDMQDNFCRHCGADMRA